MNDDGDDGMVISRLVDDEDRPTDKCFLVRVCTWKSHFFYNGSFVPDCRHTVVGGWEIKFTLQRYPELVGVFY